jgi:hypothetical protein
MLGISPTAFVVAKFAVERLACLSRCQHQLSRMTAWKSLRLCLRPTNVATLTGL